MGRLIDTWSTLPLWTTITAAVLISGLVTWLLRKVIGLALYRLVFRAGNRYFDLVVDRLKPFHFVWFVPLLLVWYAPWVVSSSSDTVRTTVAVLMAWVGVDLAIRLLESVNDINRHRKYYRGVSIAGYMDLLKVVVIIAAVVYTIRSFWDVSNEVLLGGIGAWLAVIMLVFKDTLLSFVASIQITSQDLIKEGDWIEVPSLGIDGTVLDIDLHTIKVQNFDNTISPIATHRIRDLSYKNWRGMEESGGRRMVFTILVDQHTIRLANADLMARIQGNQSLKESLLERLQGERGNESSVTNIQLYLWFAQFFLKNRRDLHQRRLMLFARLKDPTSLGIPIQVYAYTRTVDLIEHEEIKAEILSYLMATLDSFDLRIFQEATND